jgi:hypothetical protein
MYKLKLIGDNKNNLEQGVDDMLFLAGVAIGATVGSLTMLIG